MFSREIDALPDPLSILLPSVWCPHRLTSIDSINQNFLPFYFLFGSANGRHQIERRGQEKREFRIFIPLML